MITGLVIGVLCFVGFIAAIVIGGSREDKIDDDARREFRRGMWRD